MKHRIRIVHKELTQNKRIYTHAQRFKMISPQGTMENVKTITNNVYFRLNPENGSIWHTSRIFFSISNSNY